MRRLLVILPLIALVWNPPFGHPRRVLIAPYPPKPVQVDPYMSHLDSVVGDYWDKVNELVETKGIGEPYTGI